VRLERGKPPAKWIVRIVVALVITSQGLALIGDLFLAGIVDKQPALLIALNPRNRNLALATNQLSAITFYTIGFARLVASDPLYYLLGYWYGDRAIAWTERRSRTYGPLIRDGERMFRKASYPLIFFAPNNIICALSAATGVRLATFIALNLTGTVARLVLVRQLGEVFRSPIDAILGFIADYRIPLLILSAIAVAWTIFGEFRGDNSELDTLRHLDSEDGDGDEGSGSDSGSAAETADDGASDTGS
jgi:membrane protein DedA with SNARE-associated domain